MANENKSVIAPEEENQIVEEVTDAISGKLVAKLVDGFKAKMVKAFGEDSALTQESEAIMEGQKLADGEKETVRKMLDGLPKEAQSMWLKTYFDAKAYAQTQNDLRNKASEYAGRTAWASVKTRFTKTGEGWQNKKASISFDAAIGKWIVDHPHFLLPVSANDKKSAELLLGIVADSKKPDVKVVDNTFSITHPDWVEPVVAQSAEEATSVVTRKLVDEGWSNNEAEATAQELIVSKQKEKIMGSIEVNADTKQNMNKGEVSGIQSDEGASSPKNQQPNVGGKVSIESPPKGKTPETTCHEGQTTSDYAAAAGKMDKTIQQVNRQKGLMKACAKLASTDEGFQKLMRFVAEAEVIPTKQVVAN